MPRYFLNRTNGRNEYDEEGTELASVEMAAIQAVLLAGETLREAPKQIWGGQDFRVDVTDHTGLVLFSVVTIGIKSPATEHAD